MGGQGGRGRGGVGREEGGGVGWAEHGQHVVLADVPLASGGGGGAEGMLAQRKTDY